MATNSSFRTLTLSNIEGIAEEKNYLKSNFENASTSGWNKFTTTLTSGVPTGSLTVGTAASITFFDAYAVNPLTGKLSLRVNSGNTGWTAGQGIISDVITIDRQDQGKVLNITFDYEPIINPSSINFSGVLGQQTFAIYVYDVTASAWVQPAGFLSMTGNGISTARATFQTAMVAGQQYRVAIVCLQTTPSISVGLVFDNFQMTRSNYIYGTPVTDWQSYTPTFTGFGTATSVQFQWRRVGADLEVRGKFTSGTSTATEGRVSFPSGLTSGDTSLIPSLQHVGMAASSATAANSRTVLIEPSVGYFTFGLTTAGPLTKANGSTLFSSGETCAFFGKVPISGWSSSVQTSDSADTRVVAARATKSANQNIATTAATTITWNTYTIDTHGGFSGNTYTIPVSGYYRINLTVDVSGITSGGSGYCNMPILRNGSIIQNYYFYTIQNEGIGSNTGIFLLSAGDQITATAASPDGNYDVRATNTFISIERLSGPSAIAASETVAAKYSGSVSATVSTTAPIQWNTKQYDTHNAVTTGANWRFTAPISGIYRVSATTYTSSGAVALLVAKNGSSTPSAISDINTTQTLTGSTTISLLAGDYIDVRTRTGSATVIAFTEANICIERIGNYA